MSDICFIDFETTGTIPEIHSPLQLGAVLAKEKSLVPLQYFSEYILPPQDVVVEPGALEVNGLDINNMPITSILPYECLQKFWWTFKYDYRFAAWNTHFDVSIFRGMCIKNGQLDLYKKLDYHHIDIQSIVQHLKLRGDIPRGVISFNNALEYFDLKRSGKKHDAYEDAHLLRKLYYHLKVLGGDKSV